VSDLLVRNPLPWHKSAWEDFHEQLKPEQLSHAFLISAEADSGKRRFATMLAHWLLCEAPHNQQACGACGACLLSKAGNNPDFVIIEPEEKSRVIKIDQIRELKQFIETSSHAFGKRIILIDSAENLNINSANALLKSLEEPPADVVFLLLSDRPRSVLPTISSRCRALKLPKAKSDQALQWLQTQVSEASSEEVEFALDYAQGRPFKALATLIDASAPSKKALSKDLLTLMQGKETVSKMVSRYYKSEALDVLNLLAYWLSVIVKFQVSGNGSLVKGQELQEVVALVDVSSSKSRELSHALLGLYGRVCEAQSQAISVSNPNMQLLLEDLLLQLQQIFRLGKRN
jgi:DNA polymerase-3 subunit delta'